MHNSDDTEEAPSFPGPTGYVISSVSSLSQWNQETDLEGDSSGAQQFSYSNLQEGNQLATGEGQSHAGPSGRRDDSNCDPEPKAADAVVSSPLSKQLTRERIDFSVLSKFLREPVVPDTDILQIPQELYVKGSELAGRRTRRVGAELMIPAEVAFEPGLSRTIAQENGWLEPAVKDKKLQKRRKELKYSIRFKPLNCGAHESAKQHREASSGRRLAKHFGWDALSKGSMTLSLKLELARNIAMELKPYMEKQAHGQTPLKYGTHIVEFEHVLIVGVVYPTVASMQPVLGIRPEYKEQYYL
ncbi:hypothetical protein FKP32DRAFT_1204435 [Trametes sanguinea]|nr:hypothetical protein FKP32DRAFT_1204435 [Trametes sanguinea]